MKFDDYIAAFIQLMSSRFASTKRFSQTRGMASVENIWLVLVVVIAVASYLLLQGFRTHERSRRLRLPPSPSGAWPILGHMPLLGVMPHQNLMKMAKKYGPLMYLHLGYVPTVIVSSPEMLREVFQVNDVIMASRPKMVVTEILGYGCQDIVGSPYGAHWRKMRKLFVQELLNPKRLQEFQFVRRTEILSTVESILHRAKTNRDVGVDLKTELRDLTVNNITRMMLGKKSCRSKTESTTEGEEFAKCAEAVTHFAGTYCLGDFVPILKRFDLQGVRKKLKGVRSMFDRIVDKIIMEHRTGNSGEGDGVRDFVDVLLDNQQKEGLSDEVLKGVIFDMLLGGTDTSSTSLEWLMAELIRSPKDMILVQKELDEVVGRDRLVEESDVPKLKHLVACVKEIFRRRPVIPLMVPHESTASSTVGGYDLPAKTRVIVNMWAIHMDPAVWESPEEFRPERFLHSQVDVRGQHFSLVPFGTGRRMCVGINLGLILVQYSAAVLLQAFNWTLPQRQDPKDLDMSDDFGISLSKKLPLRLVPTLRLPLHVYAFENLDL